MNKIVIFLIACTTCDLERLYFDYNYKSISDCSDKAHEIYKTLGTFHWYEEGKYQHSAYYTPDGKLIIGHRCD
jgi:hypothetical protein